MGRVGQRQGAGQSRSPGRHRSCRGSGQRQARNLETSGRAGSHAAGYGVRAGTAGDDPRGARRGIANIGPFTCLCADGKITPWNSLPRQTPCTAHGGISPISRQMPGIPMGPTHTTLPMCRKPLPRSTATSTRGKADTTRSGCPSSSAPPGRSAMQRMRSPARREAKPSIRPWSRRHHGHDRPQSRPRCRCGRPG